MKLTLVLFLFVLAAVFPTNYAQEPEGDQGSSGEVDDTPAEVNPGSSVEANTDAGSEVSPDTTTAQTPEASPTETPQTEVPTTTTTTTTEAPATTTIPPTEPPTETTPAPATNPDEPMQSDAPQSSPDQAVIQAEDPQSDEPVGNPPTESTPQPTPAPAEKPDPPSQSPPHAPGHSDAPKLLLWNLGLTTLLAGLATFAV